MSLFIIKNYSIVCKCHMNSHQQFELLDKDLWISEYKFTLGKYVLGRLLTQISVFDFIFNS